MKHGDAAASERLARFLAAVEPDRSPTIESYRPIIGGYSRIIAQAQVLWSDGGTENLLIRGDPEEEGVFHSDREAEWRLLQALSNVDEVATPAARWYDATGEYFGTKCIITEFCTGTNLLALLQDGEDLDGKTALWVDTIAAIHRTPLAALPPELIPADDWDSYLESVIQIYDRRDLFATNPAARYVAAFLRANRPPPVPLTLVHGDANPGNVLVAQGQSPVVIDWEFGRVGDPREDLGYYALMPMEPRLYDRDPEGFLARYREASGLSESQVNRHTVDYFRMIGMARLLAQLSAGAKAVADGRPGAFIRTYLVNAMSYQWDEYLHACRRLS